MNRPPALPGVTLTPSDALELPSVRVHVTLGSAADTERTIALEQSF